MQIGKLFARRDVEPGIIPFQQIRNPLSVPCVKEKAQRNVITFIFFKVSPKGDHSVSVALLGVIVCRLQVTSDRAKVFSTPQTFNLMVKDRSVDVHMDI